MIKAEQVFFWTSNLKGHSLYDDKATILYLTSEYFHYLCCLQNFIFLKSVQYIKSYGHLHLRYWKSLIQIFSTEKTPYSSVKLSTEDLSEWFWRERSKGYNVTFDAKFWRLFPQWNNLNWNWPRGL